jgi:hypothetical protein
LPLDVAQQELRPRIMLPQWSFCQLLMSQIPVCLAGRVRYAKVNVDP